MSVLFVGKRKEIMSFRYLSLSLSQFRLLEEKKMKKNLKKNESF